MCIHFSFKYKASIFLHLLIQNKKEDQKSGSFRIQPTSYLSDRHLSILTEEKGDRSSCLHPLGQGCQNHFQRGPHQPCGCLQRAEGNFRTV